MNFNCAGSRWSSPWFNSQQDSTTASFVSVDPGVTTLINGKVTESGAITGKVTSAGGRPLSGICALLANPQTRLLVNPESPESVATGLDGRYRFSGLTPGRYLLQFSDCNTPTRYETVWYPDRATAARATSVLVRPGQTVKRVNAVLVGGGRISGTVTGPSGQPLANYCVQAFDRAALSSQIASTGPGGRYTVAGLGTGRYSLYFYSCYTGGPNIGEASWPGLVPTRVKQATTGINIKLKRGGSVSGTVLGGPGRPVRQAGICVDAVPRNSDGSQPFVATGTRGRYVITDLGAGRYQIYFSDPFCNPSTAGQGQDLFAPQWYNGQLTQARATTITVSADHTDVGIGATLRQFGSIGGTVDDAAGRGVGGECVTAVPFHQRPDPFAGLFLAPEVAITTGTGHYALLGLASGRYKIEFSVGCGDTSFATAWWKGASSAKSATVINVTNAAISGIDATLHR